MLSSDLNMITTIGKSGLVEQNRFNTMLAKQLAIHAQNLCVHFHNRLVTMSLYKSQLASVSCERRQVQGCLCKS